MGGNRGRKEMKKPAKGSGLNPCLQPDGSQLGIPNEFTEDPSGASQPIMLALHEEPLDETYATSSSTAARMAYNYTLPSSLVADGTSYDYPLPSSLMAHPTSYSTAFAHMTAPWAHNFDARLSETPMSHHPAGDALPFCGAPDLATTIQPMCLPTPSILQYPQELSPYPIVSSGIRHVFAYGPRRPSETERGSFVNIGVIKAGANHTITSRRQTRRTLPPTSTLLPPPTPEAPTNETDETPIQNITQLPPDQLSKVIQEAKNGMRRRLICTNIFPTQVEANSFAEDAITDALRTLITDPHWVLDRAKDGKAISQVLQIPNSIRTLFKNVARAQVLIGYGINVCDDDLLLDQTQIRESVRGRIQHLLRDYNFLYTESLDVDDAATIDGLVALAGAALSSALHEYCEGVVCVVESSNLLAGERYREIIQIIRGMSTDEELCAQCKKYCRNLSNQGSSPNCEI
ncbi:hypothetical protein F5J12DRAFT_838209 [Pisolithus orientalis]|uniref:uncharacterized protein n=1 Tax=Pisolithus orientalis TaxID=936130 RepID=UPI0022259E30|nr:uncharacterized protein F5J12DRAFT_838209 [Pisolithus orientalis]KAI6003490.1 hypothetical protein F5J12DRAFT_838209 [Pisolithus orientalis]